MRETRQARRPAIPPAPARTGRTPLIRLWPWRASVIAWLVVVVLIGAIRHHYTGIYGFSTANYGWLAFTLVGGCVLAWRLAGRPPLIAGLVRPLLPAAAACVFCYAAVALMGLIFLPGHPLQGGGDTEGPFGGALHPLGRALPVAEVVAVVGWASELLRGLRRLTSRPPFGGRSLARSGSGQEASRAQTSRMST